MMPAVVKSAEDVGTFLLDKGGLVLAVRWDPPTTSVRRRGDGTRAALSSETRCGTR